MYNHIPVLLKQAIKCLKIKKNGIYLDCTLGEAGHTKLILSKLNTQGKLISIDRDINSIQKASYIKDIRLKLIHTKFSKIIKYLKNKKLLGKINGILIDLGLSSAQIDNPNRGFSYMKNGILDMRMDSNNINVTASKWINSASLKEIDYVIREFGEERFHKRIAKSIFIRRNKKPILETLDLAQIISGSIPNFNKIKSIARSFQAIRIFINDEILELNKILKNIYNILAIKGRLVIISFHSIESKIVKDFIKLNSNIPLLPNNLSISEKQINEKFRNFLFLKNLGKIKPNIKEIRNNIRSRSAILRFAEKIK